MPIVVARTGDIAPKTTPIPQEQREALWAAIVKNWTEKHPEEFQSMLTAPQTARS